ncbi:beta-glucuronidase [Dysgonomonas sp. Marseille-P4677]|uniref:glycoside hydrolase family 2 protein n=1 Tax=Dysgonomonas sp. Marseille-P4677 TaxID=2364790 RepID=UPI0019118EC0|nr:sugar-binding domain-containing protein [Dysgonomonas sp. Marseille-P4677]MBK5721335.1 beta-glucuronidase [Dysgonomonas sp. Marseille-P4677]
MRKIVSLFVLGCLLSVCFTYAQTGIPRPEYPRPQFERNTWINLNGKWSFTFDFGKSGMDRKLFESKGFDKNITVPYCPESKLSGVEYKDFINAMWYHRKIQAPENWSDQKILLNFGAVDYYAVIYIDGKLAGRHWGGTSSFSIDVTLYLNDSKEHDLVVYVEDDQRSGEQARGKQSGNFFSQGCDYTRTTGIWQTVWMEAVNPKGLKSTYIVPDLDEERFIIEPKFYGTQKGQKLRVTVKDGNKTVSTTIVSASDNNYAIVPVKKAKTWSPESPFLYDIDLDVLDTTGKILDHVQAYAGMRKIHVEGNKLMLNNEPYFLRLVLDQGFYPTGVWTAPTDNDLKRDIELLMQAGFNGARLHQKVFEERFHYWADKLGYLTWGETSSWGIDNIGIEAHRNFLSEWEEIVVRDRNHPSIIAWTPLNEAGRPDGERAKQYERFVRDLYRISHALDYRPVNDASGWVHVITDLWTVHNYEQDGNKLREALIPKDNGDVFQNSRNQEPRYAGQPYFIDEWGGIKWVVGKQFAENTWGYGEGPKTEEEFYQRLESLTDAIISIPHMMGHCYTQLTDVEQEQNGIYNYDRTAKFDMKRIKAILSKTPQRK